ncbi:MAG: DMT family transporter [Marinosulfonomonas sp.]|nr:DMT family transporter [Marinosulfonomonas sp.]
MNEPINRPVAAVSWMVVTGILFVTVTAVIKHVGTDLPAAESAFLRYALGLVFLIPMIKPMLRAVNSGKTLGLFAVRGLFHGLGMIMWFYGMTRIPIAEVTAINYISPVFITIGAAVFLGEKLAARRITAIGVALIGALIILRPGIREVSSGHLAMVATSMLFAVSFLVAKAVSARAEPLAVVGMLSLGVTICLTPFAIAVWVTPTLAQVGWMFVAACIATLGHYTMTKAFISAPMAVTQPVAFLQLVWAVLFGIAFFSEPADIWVIIGGSIIMASISFMTWREAVLKRQSVTTTPDAAKL